MNPKLQQIHRQLVSGFYQPDDGVITFIPNIPVFQGYPVTAKIEKVLNLPVFVDNDANNAARGEYLFGSAKDSGISFLSLWAPASGAACS